MIHPHVKTIELEYKDPTSGVIWINRKELVSIKLRFDVDDACIELASNQKALLRDLLDRLTHIAHEAAK